MYQLADTPFNAVQTSMPTGDRGTVKTLAAMQRLAREAATQLEIRGNAIAALRMYGGVEHDPESETAALFRFVRDRIRFTHDPATSEFVQAPRYTLSVMAGDCDDMATLLAALLLSVGIPARFRVVASNPRAPGSFSHVYVIARVNGRDVALDPIYHSNELGYEIPRAYRRMEARV